MQNYERYRELGGIINVVDYQSAIDRANNTPALNMAMIKQSEFVMPIVRTKNLPMLTVTSVKQVEFIARVAGIELNNPEREIDRRVILYGILRSDKPGGMKYHHCQMSDQRLFAEVLRMLGDVDSLGKLINMYPHISFN